MTAAIGSVDHRFAAPELYYKIVKLTKDEIETLLSASLSAEINRNSNKPMLTIGNWNIRLEYVAAFPGAHITKLQVVAENYKQGLCMDPTQKVLLFKHLLTRFAPEDVVVKEASRLGFYPQVASVDHLAAGSSLQVDAG